MQIQEKGKLFGVFLKMNDAELTYFLPRHAHLINFDISMKKETQSRTYQPCMPSVRGQQQWSTETIQLTMKLNYDYINTAQQPLQQVQ